MTESVLWTASDILKATHGKCDKIWEATHVAIDSRDCKPGSLFFALCGPHLNGHNYVKAALDAGAVAAVVHEPPLGLGQEAPLVWVKDSYQALVEVARFGRIRSKARRIAITGSVGKTTMKESLLTLLQTVGHTHANVASYNNHGGVPVTLARMPQETEFGIFEIGMNHAGEITPLTQLVQPHIALITTVTEAHIGHFDSLKAIGEAKAEIFKGLMHGGTAILNHDNAFFDLLKMRALESGADRIVTFGQHPDADVRLKSFTIYDAALHGVASYEGKDIKYTLAMPGEHWAMNSVALLATLVALDLPIDSLVPHIERLGAIKGRGQKHTLPWKGGILTLLDESYNANPTSMTAALQILGHTAPSSGGRRIVALGDMGELGDLAEERHLALRSVLVHNHVDQVFTCRPLMGQLFNTLAQEMRGVHRETSQELIQDLLEVLQPGDVVMIKGSLSARMGLIVTALLDHQG